MRKVPHMQIPRFLILEYVLFTIKTYMRFLSSEYAMDFAYRHQLGLLTARNLRGFMAQKQSKPSLESTAMLCSPNNLTLETRMSTGCSPPYQANSKYGCLMATNFLLSPRILLQSVLPRPLPLPPLHIPQTHGMESSFTLKSRILPWDIKSLPILLWRYVTVDSIGKWRILCRGKFSGFVS